MNRPSITKLEIITLLSSLAAAAASCNGGPPDGPAVGSLQARLQATSAHDVATVRYTVVPAGASCASPPLAQHEVPLEVGALPAGVQPDGGGTGHASAAAFFALAPGDYQVCVQPLKESGDASDECQPAHANAGVFAGQTTEITIVSQCRGDSTGGLDGVTVLNDPPRIDGIDVVPSTFIDVCAVASISVAASDPNGDAITYDWRVVSAPPGAGVKLTASGATATFTADVAADYEVKVTATDVYDASASLTLPVHVSGGAGTPGSCGLRTVRLNVRVQSSSVGGRVTSTSPPGGIDCTDDGSSSDCTETYPPSTIVTLRATKAPESDAKFAGWLPPCPGGKSLETTFSMDADMTCVAVFDPRVRLLVHGLNGGGGTVTTDPQVGGCDSLIGNCTFNAPFGVAIRVTARPFASSTLSQLSCGDCGGETQGDSAIITPRTNCSCTIVFSGSM